MGDYRREFNRDSDACKLILCDCNNTLLSARSGEPLNERLVTFLDEAKKHGYRVVIFSNDSDGNVDQLALLLQRRFKDREYFGPIQSKEDFIGTKALMVFDDNHTSHAVDAEFKLSPTDDTLIERLTRNLFTVLDHTSSSPAVRRSRGGGAETFSPNP